MATLAGEHNTAPNGTESISESSQSYGKPASRNGPPETIKVDGNKSLTLTSENLLLNDPSANKANRTCGFAGFGASAPSTQTIPLYNVLWAEQTGEALTIDYAKQAGKQQVQAAKWTFTLNDVEGSDVKSWIDTLMRKAYGPAKLCKRAKVLVNPHAGPGGAEKKWRVDVEPLFKAARMPMDVEHTTYSGQALEVAREVDVDAFDTIVTCSGDGLAHEVFNGLGQRPDASQALHKIAVSHIPCGSGNAMSCNLYDSYRPSICALAIIKGVETPMDLVSITQGDRRTLSFLSQALGVVAESDLATEHLRWMGGARFTWGFLVRIFEKKCYPCDLAVKVEIEDKAGVKKHYKEYTRSASVTHSGASEPPRTESADAVSSPCRNLLSIHHLNSIPIIPVVRLPDHPFLLPPNSLSNHPRLSIILSRPHLAFRLSSSSSVCTVIVRVTSRFSTHLCPLAAAPLFTATSVPNSQFFLYLFFRFPQKPSRIPPAE